MTRKKTVEEQEVKTTEAVQETEGAEEIMTGEVSEKTTIGKVTGGSLNVRQEPKKNATVVRVLEDGTDIEILGEEGEWYRIDDGFVMARYISIGETK